MRWTWTLATLPLLVVALCSLATSARGATCSSAQNCTACVELNTPTVGCAWCNLTFACIGVIVNAPGNYTAACSTDFGVDLKFCGIIVPENDPSELDQLKSWMRRNSLYIIIACSVFCCICLTIICAKVISNRRAKGGASKSKAKAKAAETKKAADKAADDKKRAALAAAAGISPAPSPAKDAKQTIPTLQSGVVSVDMVELNAEQMISDMYGNTDHF
eukprot:Amastigsp_a294_248.p2 type:complete len:218 gc:universal Amastigsp_a294_248:36-689(+)